MNKRTHHFRRMPPTGLQATRERDNTLLRRVLGTMLITGGAGVMAALVSGAMECEARGVPCPDTWVVYGLLAAIAIISGCEAVLPTMGE